MTFELEFSSSSDKAIPRFCTFGSESELAGVLLEHWAIWETNLFISLYVFDKYHLPNDTGVLLFRMRPSTDSWSYTIPLVSTGLYPWSVLPA